MTLAIVTKDSRILLGMKKRGFGAGRWNGFGGKLAEGESVEDAFLRELEEEVGIIAKESTKAGIIDFSFNSDPSLQIEMHIFHVTDFAGEPKESEEMEPDWFSYNEIPYNQMWVDDEKWLPHVLMGQLFTARFKLDAPATNEHPGNIESYDIDVLAELPA